MAVNTTFWEKVPQNKEEYPMATKKAAKKKKKH
jgi:hypothetical protein